LKKVIFVPASQSPNKLHGSNATAGQRLAMTRLAIRGNKHFSVSDLELRRGGISYTVDTLTALSGQYAGAEFFLILGADSFMDFPTWKSPDEIVSMAGLLVYPRSGFGSMRDREFARQAEFMPAPEIEISSSIIRRRVSSGKSIRYLVTEGVEKFILSHRLYRREDTRKQ
jgi:nicotinate-nucleotide adenylyltransferase